jgi:hypothetical protein
VPCFESLDFSNFPSLSLFSISFLLVAWHQGIARRHWPFESNSSSMAYISQDTEAKGYFTGASIFAERREFFRICEACIYMKQQDAKVPIMPVWHDESYLNKYLVQNFPKKILPGKYIYPEPPLDLQLLKMRPEVWLDPTKRHRKEKPVFYHMRKLKSLALLRMKSSKTIDPVDRVCDSVTVLVETEDQENCINAMLLSLYMLYPCIHTVVVDKSRVSYSSYYYVDNPLLTHVRLNGTMNTPLNYEDFIDTEYVFFVDEHTFFPRSLKLENFLSILESHPTKMDVVMNSLGTVRENAKEEKKDLSKSCFKLNKFQKSYMMKTELLSAGVKDRKRLNKYQCLDNSLKDIKVTRCDN